MHILTVRTNGKREFKDITTEVINILKDEKVDEAVLTLYVPHTTAGITVNEGADPNVIKDIKMFMDGLVPENNPNFTHAEGNSDAHILASIFGASLNIPVTKGKLALGTWQSIYFAEFDGPRTREVYISL